MSYESGKHDDPTDGFDRLVRIGSKYQATAPTLTDGDNGYILLDAAGRVLVAGAIAHDGVAAGNPIRVAGVYRTTLPAVAAGDIADILLSAEGRPRTEEYMVQQSRLGNAKTAANNINKITTAETTIATWTVTSGKTGYLTAVIFGIVSHASETKHTIIVYNESAQIAYIEMGQGHRVQQIEFKVPSKLVGDGVKTLTVKCSQATTNSSDYTATMLGWEE